jgi:hypothetical protein
MTDPTDADVEVLDASADPHPEHVDEDKDQHAVGLTDDEAAEGLLVYHEVDDLDDDSNGLD